MGDAWEWEDALAAARIEVRQQLGRLRLERDEAVALLRGSEPLFCTTEWHAARDDLLARIDGAT